MIVAYVSLCGFRGYFKPFHLDFPDGFTIIDGRNGVGKSTIFDAVEFVLTGTISKYIDATADRETVADYIWWSGGSVVAEDRYVEVGFRSDDRIIALRRTPYEKVDAGTLNLVLQHLYDARIAPHDPLKQLCTATIIRDEHIAALSLDLKEAERYDSVRNAIGATDADLWIERGSHILGTMKGRVSGAERGLTGSRNELSSLAARIDDLRERLVEDAPIADATMRLQAFSGSRAAADMISGPARSAIAEAVRNLEELAALQESWTKIDGIRRAAPEVRRQFEAAQDRKSRADAVLADHAVVSEVPKGEFDPAEFSNMLADLLRIGRAVGLREGHCPLCSSPLSAEEFLRGIDETEKYVTHLDTEALERTRRLQSIAAARVLAAEASGEFHRLGKQIEQLGAEVANFETRLAGLDFPKDAPIEALTQRQQIVSAKLSQAQADLSIVDTIRLNSEIERTRRVELGAKDAYAQAEVKLGIARRSERFAQALYDAARRAAGETLAERLERVLPLMAELYRRLRPHPIFDDIEYKIRGDVKRFLKLQVGGDLNPQFMFSSGQRRATGLAFLLSVNLSLTWSRWSTLLLDDPVQHIDDFRSIHLAEVLAQIASSGKQIICSVEDSALADLLCRRLPNKVLGAGKRVTLGVDEDGALAKLQDRIVAPLIAQALLGGTGQLAG